MSSRGPAEPFKKLLPQSWLGWLAAAVLTVVTVTHPAESWHATSHTIWAAGRWAGYEAFAACGTPPPYTWMSSKRCPDAVTVSTPTSDMTETGAAAGAEGGNGGPLVVDRVAAEVTHVHRIVDVALADDGAKPSQPRQGVKP